MKSKLKTALWLGLLVAVILRIPSLFEPYSYADEGIYLVLGQGFREGLVFYKQIHDNKPPLLYVTAGLAQTLQNFRLILLVWNGINIWLVWLLAKELFKRSFKPVLVSTVAFGFLSSFSLLEGNVANGELFMIMPFTAAVYLVWIGLKKKNLGYFFISGLLASVAFLYKVPVGFDLVGVAMFIAWVGWKKGEFKVGLVKQWLALGAGFLVINLTVLGYYFKVGAGKRYLTSALLQNLPYLTSWGGGEGGSILQNGLFQRFLIVVVWVGVLVYFRKRISKVTGLLGWWFIFSVYGVLLSARPYPHYWVEVLPVLSLMGGWAVTGKREAKRLLSAGVFLVMLSWAVFRFWIYPVGAYYLNFVKWVTGSQDTISYQRYWGEEVLVDIKVADYIKLMTRAQDKIYVWGTAPGIYYLSQRLPVGRYVVAYHVADFDGFDETMAALKRQKPKVIVKLKSEGLKFLELESRLDSDYVLAKVIGDREIYLRLME